MNAWSASANVLFSETRGTGEVRIARLDRPADMAGYWSYIATEILDVDASEPTLNLEGFTLKTSEAEFRRVVRHEAGHTLGFEHEHMRSEIVGKIDAKKAYLYFDRTQGWTRDEVDQQVLTPLAKQSLMGTAERPSVLQRRARLRALGRAPEVRCAVSQGAEREAERQAAGARCAARCVRPLGSPATAGA